MLGFDMDEADHGVRVLAGAFTALLYPDCTCDACDAGVTELADSLERDVFAVVAGGLSERVHRRWTESRLSLAGGRHGSESRIERRDRAQLRRLGREIPDPWPAWRPRRQDPGIGAGA